MPLHPDQISTRVPWAASLVDDNGRSVAHDRNDMHIGIDSVPVSDRVVSGKTVPGAASILRADYFDVPKAADDRAQVKAAVGHFKDNMRWIFDRMNPKVREIARHWYVGAHRLTKEIADQYQLPHRAIAGVTARLSPGTDWYKNVAMAKRITATHMANGVTDETPNGVASADMHKLMDGYIAQMKQAGPKQAATAAQAMLRNTAYGDISGEHGDLARAMFIRAQDEARTQKDPNNAYYRVIHPYGHELGLRMKEDGVTPDALGWQSLDNIGRAVSILRDSSRENISENMGSAHKIRSFYNDIIAPWTTEGHGTMDTHQIAGSHLLPIGPSHEYAARMGGSPGWADTGNRGLYGLYHEGTRQLAEDLPGNWLTREAQSTTWEGGRGLWSAKQKRDKKFTQAVFDTWKGEPDADRARDQIGRLAIRTRSGQIPDPDWFQSGAASAPG